MNARDAWRREAMNPTNKTPKKPSAYAGDVARIFDRMYAIETNINAKLK